MGKRSNHDEEGSETKEERRARKKMKKQKREEKKLMKARQVAKTLIKSKSKSKVKVKSSKDETKKKTKSEKVDQIKIQKINVWSREKEKELATKHNLTSLNFIVSGEEAGAGCWMGSCVMASCVVPDHVKIEGVNDSKILKESQREELYNKIINEPDIIWSCVIVSAEEIDKTGNILTTRMEGMKQAISEVQQKMYDRYGSDAKLQLAIIDGNKIPSGLNQMLPVETVVKGDQLCACISVASIIAKVTRDRLCRDVWDKQFPGYGFAEHKGYGTAAHKRALDEKGMTLLHRKTFRPMAFMEGGAKYGQIDTKKK